MSARNGVFAGVFFGVTPHLYRKCDASIVAPQPYKNLLVSLLSAIPSAILATVLTMPIDNCATRKQAGSLGYKTGNAFREIYTQHGWKGFFVVTDLRVRAAIIEFTAFTLFLSMYTRIES
jgi:hypothetical protein